MSLPPTLAGLPCARDAFYGCLRWQGKRDREGYGKTKNGRMAHVVAWEMTRGPVPDGRVLDHLCRRRDCVNPAHLEAVTQGENLRRRSWPYRLRTMKTCPNGHDLRQHGRIVPPLGGRICRVCSGV